MPLINLIQEQRLEIKRNERKTRIFFMACVGSVLLSVGSWGALHFQTEKLQSQESDLRVLAQKTQPIMNEIEATQRSYADVAPRLKTLEDAQVATGRWNRILEHLALNTPSATWLTALRCTAADPTAPIGVSFAGLSNRQELIGEFMLRLQNCSDLEAVGLKFTAEKAIQNSRNIEFEVSANVAGSVQEKSKNEVKEEGA
ncbi:MAG TPA: PilN domain-containing protein [Fimbriimonadaceae bacterium]|nr:PilN domain-containing protein [Fimbriimonadaceae bacterium]